jgi:DNA-binding MarR family transcriptional regulator
LTKHPPTGSAVRMTASEVRAIQRAYPQVYLACHVRHRRAATSPEGLSERDGSLLAHLDELDGERPTDLARHLGIARSTLSASLDRLVELGLVRLSPGARDRRERRAHLTSAGARAMAAASVLDSRRLERVLARLSGRERRQAAGGLSLLARASREEMWQRGRP